MDVGAWLRGLGLGQYEGAFRENEIDAAILPKLTADDLKDMGITVVGHRRKLLDAIEALRAGGEGLLPRGAGAGANQAERRQLTVMFVDLVGSTALSRRLDPEEMGGILRAYQDTVAGAITRFGGQVAKLMGDGVLAYFGWPKAHEDEAELAVRAGLAVAAVVRGLAAPDSEPLAVRVGIATGLVVVGDMVGEGSAREETVVGETPNLAARLQAGAEPGQVVIAEATRRLLGATFLLEPLPHRPLKGIEGLTGSFLVLGERTDLTRFEAHQAEWLAPLVGRDQELGLLLDRWRLARSGEGQAVLLTGDPGIGKSRIVRALADVLGPERPIVLRYQCSPLHADSPLWPVVQQLTFAAGIGADDPAAVAKLGTLLRRVDEPGEEGLAVVAELLGIEGTPLPGRLSAQQKRDRLLQVLTDQLAGLARGGSVLVLFEDVHWVDATSLELIEQSLDRIGGLPVLFVLTSRPDGQPALGGHPHLARLTLNRLGRAASEAIVGTLAGCRQLPDEIVAAILSRSDGVPLFVEELTKAVLETGGTGSGMTVPASLHDSLMSRLDRLAPVKEVAQIAACIGREFEFDLLASVAPLPEAELRAALDQLQAAELVFRDRGTPPRARFTFKHALVCDAAYASLLRHRRQAFHGRIYQVLSAAAHPAPPDTLAVHAAGAGLFLDAARHGLDAGRRALARWAPREAVQQLRRAVAHLAELPDSRDRGILELELQASLAPALVATSGYSADATGEAYARTAELARTLDQPARFAQAQFGEFLFRLVRGELRVATSVAERMLLGTAGASNGADRAMAYRAAGTSAFFVGEFSLAVRHLDEASAGLEAAPRKPTAADYVFDPATGIAVFGSLARLVIGDLARADELQARSRALAEAAGHVATVAFGHHHACFFAMASGRPEETRCRAEAMVRLAEEERLPIWLATGRVYLGWAMAVSGPGERAVDVLGDGLTRWRATGARLWLPVYLGLQADALVATGRGKEARASLEEALNHAATTADAHFVTELHRRLAALHKEAGELEAAEASLSVACRLAREQGAHLYELRAAADLARLWAEDGRRQQACDLLAAAQVWFGEARAHPDLEAARTLLETLH